ncbi:urea ABC transporter permease subunit UrtB [Marinobacter halophilus]|uniref:Urea ABC transporter permease subunit UrtB n=1 Tax=Marinobacter halophilus TaxID=1323740 RepID=A0A2T1KDX9_9GAMM|nr:urea ABC transporter permease subunit UrtB [Marinobacter halophilus]PSF08336.1 urea ABC transporter permease subunit UrtB [Marinobacter halophilus]GGC59756.1 branched-chain amino acid ABC transporter permease [Marinobacter halophilus]
MGILRSLLSLRLASLLALLMAIAAPAFSQTEEDPGQALLANLADASPRQMDAAIEAIVNSGDPRARSWLDAFGNNRLSRNKDTGQVVVVLRNVGRDWTIADPLTGENLGEISRRELDRVNINNAIRGKLEGVLAMLDLYSTNPEIQRTAAEAMMGKVNETVIEPLNNLLAQDLPARVRDRLELAVAIYQLEQGDAQAKADAITTLTGSLHSRARAALNNAVAGDDPAIAASAKAALISIEQKLKMNRAAETLYFGLSLGSVLVLAAIGLAITFGVMGVINMAHGELIMLGAYTTWGMQQLLPGQPGLALILSIPAGFMVAALAGIAIERSVIQYLKGRPLETLLATFGISLILQQLVRTVISPLNRSVTTPEWMSGSLVINDALSLTLNRLYVIGFALVVFAGLMLIMRRTRLGLEVRAVTQNRAMARSMGIKATRVDIMTFALGSGVAGLAGVALSQITNVGPNLGQNYIIDSFMVVVFGGVGNLWGTLVAGLTLGTINQILEPWAGAVLAKIMVLVMIILFIQKRPRGLFPQKGRAAEG